MVIEDKLTDIFTNPKTVLNRGAGFLLLAYSAPLLLITAAAVVLDTGGGSVLISARQDHGGALWRFRTVREGDGADTALGGFLKRTRLELLPQMVNVALGDITVLNALRSR